jgi:hypothetical protein
MIAEQKSSGDPCFFRGVGYNPSPSQKKTARKRPKSREETPKEGIRRITVARLTYDAAHQMQRANARSRGESAVADSLCNGVIFLHHTDRAFEASA